MIIKRRKKKQSIYNNNNSERLTENEINKLTKNIIKMQENISNIPLNSKINNLNLKKNDSNPLFKKSKTLTEDKIKKEILTLQISIILKMNIFFQNIITIMTRQIFHKIKLNLNSII